MNTKSNILANKIIKNNNSNINPDDLILLLLDRDERILLSILAVLKTGAAYVPLDPSYPDERLKFIIEETKCNTIITNEAYIKRLKNLTQYNIRILSFETNELISNDESLFSNLKEIAKYNNLAYVIYTSGTTGTPKGVMIEHKSFVNFIFSMKLKYFSF